MNLSEFDGKSVLVVGAGARDGIGFATVAMLAGLGARVALADLDEGAVTALRDTLASPERHSAHAIDVTDEHSVARAIDGVIAAHGRIDGLVVAAGAYAADSFTATSRAVWDQMFAVNATGTFLVAQAVARLMQHDGGGRIVLIASIGGRAPQLTAAAYGASKAAVIQLGRYMALELARSGVTVNVVCPGSTATAMMGTDPVRHDIAIHGNLAQWRLGIPLGRMADPSDQAAAITFLLGESGRHVTGQVISVDGGQTFL
ncbi:SDR family oxidoreductase [Cupriavidus sp. CV2]|uniref:SDR family NAD(P)-dependent oxidoreductase n=1 Tax=Cupriavidus ulmosensis TaxID=3065913 RepID=UPI00296B09D0|nr:SDR family oxidoreductase [Cupriavidus sp. CV2]MDW3682138.1 SDR family oxidoreductase [Cupriavidus sp. CV2]